MAKKKDSNAYEKIIQTIFFNHYKKGAKEFEFNRTEFAEIAKKLGVDVPKNLGDVIYSFRYRRPLPTKVLETASKGKTWTIAFQIFKL